VEPCQTSALFSRTTVEEMYVVHWRTLVNLLFCYLWHYRRYWTLVH